MKKRRGRPDMTPASSAGSLHVEVRFLNTELPWYQHAEWTQINHVSGVSFSSDFGSEQSTCTWWGKMFGLDGQKMDTSHAKFANCSGSLVWFGFQFW